MADRHLPIFDRVFFGRCSTISHERGLLETTLVVCLGEFGRTPKINHLAFAATTGPIVIARSGTGAGVCAGSRDRPERSPAASSPLPNPFSQPWSGATMLELAGINSAGRAELARATRSPSDP